LFNVVCPADLGSDSLSQPKKERNGTDEKSDGVRKSGRVLSFYTFAKIKIEMNQIAKKKKTMKKFIVKGRRSSDVPLAVKSNPRRPVFPFLSSFIL
jgi:hypothetical protein